MKNTLYYVLAALLFYACGGQQGQSVDDLVAQGDIEAIRAKKNELSERQKALEADMQLLDSAIAKMDTNEKLPLVTAFEASEERFDHFLDLQGDVMTRQNVLIYPEMAGTLERVYVKEGDRVRKGQVLARIDDGGMGSQLEQLKTQAALAKTTFERQKRLWEQKIGSEIQYLQAKTNYEATENAVKQTQSQLGKSTIRAPFTGIIDDVILDQGTVVAPGTGAAVFRIVNLTDMYIEVDVPESYVADVTPGKKVKVFFPVLGDSVMTQVRQTGNFINPGNRSFSVEIPVPNEKGSIKPNLTARVEINDYTNENAVLVPQSVISENAEGEQYVYVALKQNGEGKAVAEKRIITTGKTQGDFVEVLTGVEPADFIIKEGARSVRDGQEIKILE